ncbi:MAG: hypothetical protein ACKOD1_05195 [Sphingomonadales bacterium]
MRSISWLGLAAVLLLAIACTMPWILIPSKQLIISGIEAEGTRYGKPGYLHLLLGTFYFIFTLVPTVWAKRANLLVVAFNMAWTIRNFLILSLCRGGECPQRLTGMYLLLLASVLMLVAALFPKKPS